MRTRVLRVVVVLSAAALSGFEAAAAGGQASVFEVASVKRNTSGPSAPMSVQRAGDRFTVTNVPALQLVQMAFGVAADQVVGGPKWLADDRFDVVAKAPAPVASPAEWQPMVKALLTDRFGLMARMESRRTTGHTLRVARADGRLGQGLRLATADCAAIRKERPTEKDPCGIFETGARVGMTGRMLVRGMPLTMLVDLVARLERHPVVDGTGLSGAYDWDLVFTPGPFRTAPPERARAMGIDPDGPSLSTALEEQLGLTLQAADAAIDVVVVERINPPTPD